MESALSTDKECWNCHKPLGELAALPGSGGNEVIVRLTEDGRWEVTFCGDTQIATSGTLRFKRDGTLKLQTSHPE